MIERYNKYQNGFTKDGNSSVIKEDENMTGPTELVTPKTLNDFSDAIATSLNERIGDEYAAHYFYRNAANWCKNANYKNATAYFEGEASSELDHAKGLQDYLTQWNLLPAIPAAPTQHSFKNLADVINKAYEIEYDLMVKYSENQKEFLAAHPATFNFIQKYVDIQNEAVAEYSDLLNALNLVDINNRLDVLYFENNYFNQ
jgi:ferritin